MMKLLSRLKDWINKHKIRIQVDYCYRQVEEPEKVKFNFRKPEYDISKIYWYKTVLDDIWLPYYYDAITGVKKPLEQYVEYSGLDNGYIRTNNFMNVRN